MPISATGSKAGNGFTLVRRSAERGFTLVELMVVMAIIGLLSAVVVLNLPTRASAPLVEARSLVSILDAARTGAVVNARAIRVRFGGGAPIAEQRRRGAWVALPPKVAGLSRWPADVATSPGELVFDPTGTVSGASEISLTRGSGTARVLVDAEGTIRVAG
jgi:general secretion pathway protein H